MLLIIFYLVPLSGKWEQNNIYVYWCIWEPFVIIYVARKNIALIIYFILYVSFFFYLFIKSNLTHLPRSELLPGIGLGIAKCPYDPLDNSTAVFVQKGNPGDFPALVIITFTDKLYRKIQFTLHIANVFYSILEQMLNLQRLIQLSFGLIYIIWQQEERNIILKELWNMIQNGLIVSYDTVYDFIFLDVLLFYVCLFNIESYKYILLGNWIESFTSSCNSVCICIC